MAQFRKYKGVRGVRYQAVIRRRGHDLSRTFDRSDECKTWARAVEGAIDAATDAKPFTREAWLHGAVAEVQEKMAALLLADASPKPSIHWSLKKALDHYRDTITTKKKGEVQERNRIKLIQRYPLASIPLGRITDEHLETFRDERKSVGASSITIGKDLFLISSLFRIAALKGMDRRHDVRGWGLVDLANPVKLIVLPKPGKSRERRFRNMPGNHGQTEEQRILDQLRQQDHGEEMIDYVRFLVATGMRRDEVQRLLREGIFDEHGVTIAYLPESKNDDERRVVLSPMALDIALKRVGMTDPGEKLFSLSENQITHLWRKAREAVGSHDLRIHDLRHEALSRMASAGLHLGELQRQSGHRNPRTLAKYLNALPSDIARKLA